VPEELEYQQMQDLGNALTERIQAHLAVFRDQGKPLDLAEVLREYLQAYPQFQHFDVTRMLVDEAVRLGHAEAELAGFKQPKWKPINETGAKVQAHVIDQY